MSTNNIPSVIILHSLPGRLRTSISHTPKDLQNFISSIEEHDGISTISFSHHSRSILVTYNRHDVAEYEIVIRIALALSVERGVINVKIKGTPNRQNLSLSAAYSGLLLLFSSLMAYLKSSVNYRSQFLAAGATALAVLDHAWHEIKKRGYFDPEVASIGYLITGLLQKRPLSAAVLTWFATFGRHFFEMSRPEVLVQPVKHVSKADKPPNYHMVISAGSKISPAMGFLKTVVGMLKNASDGGAGSLLDEIRKVSNSHGQVLDGISWMQDGIPIEFQ